MRSEKQREASRINGKKSRGPITPTGIDISKMNGLKHGLRAAQVVLPGEDPAEFEAELKGWAGDWKPDGHTKSILVERAAVASWRLRRCVRAEKDMLLKIAARGVDERDDDDDEIDPEVEDRIDRADDELPFDPAPSLTELKALPQGVDRLIELWGRLEVALDDGPEGWRRNEHEAMLPLLGHRFDARADSAGPMAVESLRLVRDDELRDEVEIDVEEDVDADVTFEDPMPADEAAKAVARLRRGIAREVEALRALRRELVAPAPPLEEPAAAKFAGVTPELMLLHRYEMAHERSLRAAIKDLVALEKARPAGRIESQVINNKEVTDKMSVSSPRSDAGVAAAPNEPERRVVAGSSGGSRGDLGGLPRPSRRRKRGRSGA